MGAVCRVTVNIDGKKITNFKSFTEKASDINKLVELHSGYDVISLEPKNEFSLEWVLQKDNLPDWSSYNNITVEIKQVGGKTIIYGDCSVISIDDASYSGRDEVTQNINFFAKTRTVL